ncbi:MAG TPA: alpha/beta hydrolase [Steroidobacteraceae bacterium]|jgi:acetyl esterase/lipase
MEAEGLRLSERVIPIPVSVSPEARAALALERPAMGPLPRLDDKAAWKAHIHQLNAARAAAMRDPIMALPARGALNTVGGVPVYIAEPEMIPPNNRDKVLLYFHAGGLVMLGGECVGLFARLEAASTRCKVYAVDFRNPPDHPYPAALEDCLAVYRALLEIHDPEQIVVSGVSGGANLAAAVPLNARDLGLPLPAAIGLFTPELDLTESGDTFQTNRDIDVVLRRGLPELNALYADGHDLAHPYLSPLFGDFTKGFPPTFIQSGTRDIFLSNAVRMHRILRRAGVEAELHVGEAMPHGGFGNAPEDRELRLSFLHFLAKFAGWSKP